MSADEIVSALRTENLAKLTSIPGVGRKTAERLVIELRDKVSEMATGASAGSSMSASTGVGPESVYDDALSALVNLGYQKNAAEKALQHVRHDGAEPNVQKLLRAALQRLAK